MTTRNMFGFNRDPLTQARENLSQAHRAFSLAQKSKHVVALISRIEAISERAAALDPATFVNELEALVQEASSLKADPVNDFPVVIGQAELRNAARYAFAALPVAK